MIVRNSDGMSLPYGYGLSYFPIANLSSEALSIEKALESFSSQQIIYLFISSFISFEFTFLSRYSKHFMLSLLIFGCFILYNNFSFSFSLQGKKCFQLKFFFIYNYLDRGLDSRRDSDKFILFQLKLNN